MNTIQRIAKNTAALTLMSIVTMVLGLIFTVSLARYFGDAAFGKYSFALAFTALFAVFMDLGFNQLTIREVARDKRLAKKYMGNILVIKLFLSIIFFVFVVTAVNLMQYPSDTKMIVYIFGASTILTSFGGLFRAVFHAFEKMEYDSLLTIIRQIVVVSIGLTLLFLGYNLLQVVSVYLIGGVVDIAFSSLVMVKKFAKPEFELDFAFWRSSFTNAIPFGLTTIFVIIYVRIDTIMLSMMVGDAPVGWYNAAVTLVLGLTFIPSVFLGAVFPVFSKFYTSSINSLKNAYEKAFKYLFIILFPIAVGTTLLADKFILLIYGTQFIHSVIALQILIWWNVFGALNWLLGTVLLSINKQKLFAVSTGIGAIFNVIANLFFIPIMSYVGASIATIITEILLFVLLFYYVSTDLYRLPLLKVTVKTIVAGIVMGVCIYYIQSFNVLMVVAIAIVIYFIALVSIGGISEEDITLIKGGIKRV
ncbi:MAG: Polysaccharide biosynthesis protein [Candidatus Argoarchaeum ethanivorans]|uniref:Polysaccharide biosynthesis protein n=1 Tax=Candidatus Argoarchaeum ethanivorans TaxID=2608793 RepID=A0A811T4K6_9EURY|nr:MAG: Polysaccharide biosynthesis protein [Candidatus Argoarchaeum ethanivorans]